ncbi:MAG: hypothetical protein WD733_12105, partial [Bryobacterales bacterium]
LGAYMLYRSVSEQAREDRMAALGGSMRDMNAERRRPPASESAGMEPRPVEDGIEDEPGLHNPSSG